jgi:hypothetical protein
MMWHQGVHQNDGEENEATGESAIEVFSEGNASARSRNCSDRDEGRAREQQAGSQTVGIPPERPADRGAGIHRG